MLPTYLLGFLTAACSYLAQNVGISIKALSLKANAFGHVVLTNIGTLGLEKGFAPIPSPMHCCIVACVGKITKRPVVVNDQIVIRDIMTIVYTFDHRFGDAANIAPFLRIMKHILEDPDTFKPEEYPQLPMYADLAKLKKS